LLTSDLDLSTPTWKCQPGTIQGLILWEGNLGLLTLEGEIISNSGKRDSLGSKKSLQPTHGTF
jgi:hypothetical protein